MAKVIVLLSGGLDSATCAYYAREQGNEIFALSFNYGQRHIRELDAAREIASNLNVREHIILDFMLTRWGGSALTDQTINVPTEGVKPDIIPVTYVPGRNTIFLSFALSYAEAVEAEEIYIGVNSLDYSGYPDCRPEYIAAFQNMANLATKVAIEGKGPRLQTPLQFLNKEEIVQLAISLGVPVEKTLSCYLGEIPGCGMCDSCRLRDAALLATGHAELTTNGQKQGGN